MNHPMNLLLTKKKSQFSHLKHSEEKEPISPRTAIFNEFDQIFALEEESRQSTDDGYQTTSSSTYQTNNINGGNTSQQQQQQQEDYVDVDEIDESMEDFHSIIEQLKENETYKNDQVQLRASELREELQSIYDTLYHAVYDCSNIADGKDPVPYALIVELQKEIDKDLNKSAKLLAENNERGTQRRSSLISRQLVIEEVNKVRKGTPPASPCCDFSRPDSPVFSAKKILVDSHVVRNVRKSFVELKEFNVDETIQRKLVKLVDLVMIEKNLSDENKEQMIKEIQAVIEKY